MGKAIPKPKLLSYVGDKRSKPHDEHTRADHFIKASTYGREMKILITGTPESGQREVIQKLTKGHYELPDNLCGLVLDHTFRTKYFETECGLWVDEFSSCQEWSEEYSSSAAKEVRNALVLFIVTFDLSMPDTSGLAGFVNKLNNPGICLAVAKDQTSITKVTENLWRDLGFDMVSMEELEPIVHSALYDSMSNECASSLGAEKCQEAAPRELDDILKELQDARNSQTMSKEEKKALSQKIAAELELL